MKITKLGHSCLLVEMPAPLNRTALFDPGMFSTVDADSLVYLDDIIITHIHPDHFDLETIQKLVAKFPNVHITAPNEVVEQLDKESIAATSATSEGIALFTSPHEDLRPLGEAPQEIGVHYLERLSHPGDSHSFTETMPVLALPVTAPWGYPLRAMQLAVERNPRYVIPIHDWFWHDQAREWHYDRFESVLKPAGITLIRPVQGEAFVLDV